MLAYGKYSLALLLISVLLISGQTQVASNPLASNYRGSNNPSTEASTNRSSICTSKGVMCEVLCKNNPLAGGKVCNCDNYVLSNRNTRVYQGCHGMI